MKAIMKSENPIICMNILNGIQKLIIAKTCPKCDLPIDVYIYCTKDSKTKLSSNSFQYYIVGNKDYKDYLGNWNGKVVAKFTLNKVEQIEPFEEFDSPMGLAYKLTAKKIITCQKAQLTYDEYNHYLKGKTGYAWHIDNLEIFDKPKELGEFKPVKWDKCGIKDKNGLYQCVKCPYGGDWLEGCKYKPLTKASKNWGYVEK